MAEVILALDLPGGTEALRLLDDLEEVRWVKVGIGPHDPGRAGLRSGP